MLINHTIQRGSCRDRPCRYPFHYPHRRHGHDLAFWLPKPLDLAEILAQFEGIPLEGISRQPVHLEHILEINIYLEIMQQSHPVIAAIDQQES